MPHDRPLVAVDIGNSRMKLGLFGPAEAGLPQPQRTWETVPSDDGLNALASWLRPLAVGDVDWWIGSVNRPALARLQAWLHASGAAERMTLLAAGDLPLAVEVPRPDLVGIDRLLNALAANRLRPAGRGAIVVDLGSAITVDRVSRAGAFLGGAILPGIGTAARALHEFTDLLPLVDMAALADPPPPLGTTTEEALRSGLYWGAVGAVRELISRLSADASPPPQVLLTGGAAPSVAGLLAPGALYVPHLTLGGIALAAAL